MDMQILNEFRKSTWGKLEGLIKSFRQELTLNFRTTWFYECQKRFVFFTFV